MVVFKDWMIAHWAVVTDERYVKWMDRLNDHENDPCHHSR